MSARRIDSAGALPRVTVQARQTQLSLSPDAVVIRSNGIEFRSPVPFAPWTEMTLTLQAPLPSARVHTAGVVVACSGNRHAGYHVSMVFTSMSRQSQARLHSLAHASLA